LEELTMLTICRASDWTQLKDPAVAAWLRQEHRFIDEQEPDGSEWGPDNTGWLVVLEPGDDIHNLPTGVEAMRDLTALDFDWTLWSPELRMWTGATVVANNFGLAWAVPQALVTGTPLLAKLKEAEACVHQ
jgi:hypothetical protein